MHLFLSEQFTYLQKLQAPVSLFVYTLDQQRETSFLSSIETASFWSYRLAFCEHVDKSLEK